MNPLKEQAKLNREIVEQISAELGVPEEKVPRLVELLSEALKPQLGDFVGRRSFLGGLAGVGAAALGMGIAGADTKITGSNVVIDDQWYLKAPAPFSALVGIDGSNVIAYDWKGKEIASGVAGVDDASVIQSTVNDIGEGKIFIRKGTYVINQKISCPAGVFFEGEGTELDLTQLDDVAFEFNNDSNLVYDILTGMKGFKVVGSSTNLNTLLVKASQIVRGFVLEKVLHKYLNNLVEIRGACYDATIRDCWGEYLKGVWIKLVTIDLNGTAYKPNGSEIINCELSNSWSDPGGSGIEIYSSNVDTSSDGAVGTIKIHNCWLEALNVGIYSEAKSTIISSNGLISCLDKGVYINTRYVGGTPVNKSGNAGIITSNRIVAPQSTSYGVYIDGGVYHHIVSSNYFDYFYGTAIYCTNKQYLTITSNKFNFGTGTPVAISGNMNYSLIINNSFLGNVPSPRGIGVNISGAHSVIISNIFAGLEYPINSPSLSYVYESNNEFYSNTNNPILGGRYLNKGTATITAGNTSVTVAHGLVSTPSKVIVTPIGDPGARFWVANITSTSFDIVVAAAPAADIQFHWEAEV